MIELESIKEFMSKHDSLNLAEYVFIAASVAGTIGAAISKEIIFAAIPLTITLGLNAIDRQRFKKLNKQEIEHLQNLIQQTQESQNQTNASFNSSIEPLFLRQKEDRELTNRVPPEIQKHIDELEETCKNSIRSIDSLTKDFSQLKNLFSNSPLVIDVEELKKQIKQVNKILEYLNNTKAEKQELIDLIESINSLVKNFSNNVVEEVKPLDDRIKHDIEQEINDLGDRIKNAFEPLNNLF